jgi:hypothetical protein
LVRTIVKVHPCVVAPEVTAIWISEVPVVHGDVVVNGLGGMEVDKASRKSP